MSARTRAGSRLAAVAPKVMIQAGTVNADVLTNGSTIHPQSADTIVEGNSGPLVIGNLYKPFPAVNTRVRNHQGSVKLILHTGTTM